MFGVVVRRVVSSSHRHVVDDGINRKMCSCSSLGYMMFASRTSFLGYALAMLSLYISICCAYHWRRRRRWQVKCTKNMCVRGMRVFLCLYVYKYVFVCKGGCVCVDMHMCERACVSAIYAFILHPYMMYPMHNYIV